MFTINRETTHSPRAELAPKLESLPGMINLNKNVIMPDKFSIPIIFVPEHLAVNEAQMIEILNLKHCRTLAARKLALYRILARLGIEDQWLPGRVFPLCKLQAALAQD